MYLEIRSYIGRAISTKISAFSGGQLNFALTFLSEKRLLAFVGKKSINGLR